MAIGDPGCEKNADFFSADGSRCGWILCDWGDESLIFFVSFCHQGQKNDEHIATKI